MPSKRSADTVRSIINALAAAGWHDSQPVIEAVQAVERYVFHEGAQREWCKPHQDANGPTPSSEELHCLIDGLQAWIVRYGEGISAQPLLDLGKAQRIRSAGNSPVVMSGFLTPAFQPPNDDEAWKRALGGAADLLCNLRILLTRPEPTTPWEGQDFEDLQRTPRQLLLYMHGKEKAQIDDDMCKAVWSEPFEKVTDNAVYAAINKANQFLRSRQHRGVLSKVRGEAVIRWE
jgi:hypothetical protein